MKVVIDTNVLFSAAYRIGSVPFQVLIKATEPPYTSLICTQSIDELRRKFKEKYPNRADEIEVFICYLESSIEIIPIPDIEHPDEVKLRDPDDATILRAAIAAGAEIIISNDLDFLESGITNPKIVSIAQFYDMKNPYSGIEQ